MTLHFSKLFFFQYIITIVTLILIVCSINSCTTTAPVNELALYTPAYFDSTLNVYLSASVVNDNNKKLSQHDSLSKDLKNIYTTKQLKWQGTERLAHSPFINEVITACENAEMHGFSPNDYPTQELKKLYNDLYTNQQNLTEEDKKTAKVLPIQEVMDKKVTLDVLTTQTALAFMHDVFFGRIGVPKRWDVTLKQKDLSILLTDTSQQISFKKIIDQLIPQHPGYYELAGKLNEYENLKKQGGFPTVATNGYGKGKKGKNINTLAQRLSLSNDLEEPYEGDAIFDDKLIEAVKKFQQRHSLKATGDLDPKTITALNKPIEETINLIRLNLERYRWLPEKLTTNEVDNYVFVNVPEYHIRCYRNGEVDFESIAVVGETITPTPVFQDIIEFMVFSPVWNIPASIAREEIFQYALINPGVLIAGDTEVYYKGKKVNPYSVNWKEAIRDKRSYSFRQKPTDQNSMGDVKFKFPNKHGVYLHDTPSKKDFKLDYRAKSSGCVRVGRPAELAEYLLQDKKEKWTIDRIKSNMKGSKERRVNMEKDVPVFIYYLTAWVDENGDLRTAKDIYKHDKRQLPLLVEGN